MFMVENGLSCTIFVYVFNYQLFVWLDGSPCFVSTPEDLLLLHALDGWFHRGCVLFGLIVLSVETLIPFDQDRDECPLAEASFDFDTTGPRHLCGLWVGWQTAQI